jgi:hypothetical protein
VATVHVGRHREGTFALNPFGGLTLNIRDSLPPDFPAVVTLCGSTRFMRAFYDANTRETLAGKIVLTVGMSSHGDYHPTEEQKAALDELHKRKIDLSQEILVLNCLRGCCDDCGRWYDRADHGVCDCLGRVTPRPYIGDSTAGEIAYALAAGKKVRYLEDLP